MQDQKKYFLLTLYKGSFNMALLHPNFVKIPYQTKKKLKEIKIPRFLKLIFNMII